MSGKKKRSRWIGALAALLGVVCALILCALFYGTMVYQLAGESGEDAAPAGGTLALSAGTLEDESRQNIRMGGKTCDVLTRTYRLSGFFRLTILKNGENGRKREKTGGDRN